MTYLNNPNNILHHQQPHTAIPVGPASAMFQPGYAGTHSQEVRHWNQGGHIPATAAPTYGMSQGGGFGGAHAIFQPGFAGTNAQEVQQRNASFGAPQHYGYMQAQQGGYMQAQPAYQPPLGAHSVFSPGFAGTNVHEVQARNHSYSGQMGYAAPAGYTAQGYGASAGSIFSPAFAGTNVQEVRQLNQGGFAPAPIAGDGFGMHSHAQVTGMHAQAQAQAQEMGSPLGSGAHAMYSPGFAGTNVQEVRSLNQEQGVPHPGSIFPGSF